MQEIISKVRKLINLYKSGALGGEIMPEDSNPHLDKSSEENYIYYTLPMALNYQRNSYTLWKSALNTWNDENTNNVFEPRSVCNMNIEELRNKLVKYKVALQPNKQSIIWQTLCNTLVNNFDGSVKNLFLQCDNDIIKIKEYILSHKQAFPYLSGTKILNYWLYVMSEYTDVVFTHRECISIAPDTHVLQSSVRLGVINADDLSKSNIRDIVSARWEEILKGTDISPIDIHTPFWLWSRNGFRVEI